jgi:homopolymeric O-antigen transport system permease protein
MLMKIESAAAQPLERRRQTGGKRETLGRDLFEGIRAWPVWSTLGWNDIRQRYRRSVLGPIWITLSMAVLVVTLGVIYSRVFKTNITVYLPFLSLGFIVWGFISASISECCHAFDENEAIIKQIAAPFSLHILRVIWRNVIVFLHTIIVFVPVAIWAPIKLTPVILLAIPGLMLLCLHGVWLGLVVAIVSTRFRDVPLIVANILQIVFFGTPIIWPASSLGSHAFIANINPAYHIIELVRGPLLGQAPPLLSWVVSGGLVVIGTFLAMALFRRVERRIVYWL